MSSANLLSLNTNSNRDILLNKRDSPFDSCFLTNSHSFFSPKRGTQIIGRQKPHWVGPALCPYIASLSRAASWWLRSNRFRISYISWGISLSSTSELVFHLRVAKAFGVRAHSSLVAASAEAYAFSSVPFLGSPVDCPARVTPSNQKLWNGSFILTDIGPSSNWPFHFS